MNSLRSFTEKHFPSTSPRTYITSLQHGTTSKRVALACALILPLSMAHAADNVFNADSVSLDYASAQRTDIVNAGVQWNWDKTWFDSNGTGLSGFWDASVGEWQNRDYRGVRGADQNITSISFTPVFRWEADSRKGLYEEAAVGLSLMSQLYENHTRYFSTSFQFVDHVGLGYVFQNGMDLGFKLEHVSNGAVKHPNPGANFAGFRVAYAF